MKWSELKEIQRNALIAEKVMGWQWIPYTFRDVSSTDDQVWLLPDGEAVAQLSPGEWTYYEEDAQGRLIGNRFIPYWIPHYTTSLDAAWGIVQKFDEVELSMHVKGKWHCSLWRREGKFQASAQSPQEAICIAALHACGVIVEA